MFCGSTGDDRFSCFIGRVTLMEISHSAISLREPNYTKNILCFWFSVKPCTWILARVAWLLLESIKPLLCHTWLFCKSCLDERSQWSISNNPIQKLNNQGKKHQSIFECRPLWKQHFEISIYSYSLTQQKWWLSNLALLLKFLTIFNCKLSIQ